MKISKEMENALNKQINEEMYSAYLYQAMSAHFEGENLSGFATWFTEQAKEEIMHAMKLYKYIFERQGSVELLAIAKPPRHWKSVLDAFQEAYKHEQYITGLINKLVDVAQKKKDYATVNMLQWFVAEQVEEEATVDEIVQKLKMAKDSRPALLMLDEKFGQRAQVQTEE